MFEGLKKKLSSFASRLAKKEEEKLEGEQKAQEPAQQSSADAEKIPEPAAETKPQVPKHAEEQKAEVQEVKKPEPAAEPTTVREDRYTDMPTAKTPIPASEAGPEAPDAVARRPEKPKEVQKQAATPAQERKEQPRATIATKIKGIFLREISVKDEDIEPFIEDLRTSLLQSDVNYDAAEKILEGIRKGLVDKKLSSRGIDSQISQVIRSSILDILRKRSAIDLVKMAADMKSRGEMPLKILFIGPNGAGKTTTMAKLAHMFLKNGFSCVLSASDTFRAAAIEQTAIHAQRLGINVIKGTYGADPASVAFDAIAHAKAHRIDVVLIDSAGRQETNKSLMDEVKKMVRVAKPDLKVFVGESIAGNTLLNQVREFNAAVGLDGVILTKLDCDAKGGNTLSIISEADVPVIYLGLGEGYDDIMPFSPEFIADNIVQNN